MKQYKCTRCSSGMLPITLPACWCPPVTFLHGRRCICQVTVSCCLHWEHCVNSGMECAIGLTVGGALQVTVVTVTVVIQKRTVQLCCAAVCSCLICTRRWAHGTWVATAFKSRCLWRRGGRVFWSSYSKENHRLVSVVSWDAYCLFGCSLFQNADTKM